MEGPKGIWGFNVVRGGREVGTKLRIAQRAGGGESCMPGLAAAAPMSPAFHDIGYEKKDGGPYSKDCPACGAKGLPAKFTHCGRCGAVL